MDADDALPYFCPIDSQDTDRNAKPLFVPQVARNGPPGKARNPVSTSDCGSFCSWIFAETWRLSRDFAGATSPHRGILEQHPTSRRARAPRPPCVRYAVTPCDPCAAMPMRRPPWSAPATAMPKMPRANLGRWVLGRTPWWNSGSAIKLGSAGIMKTIVYIR